MKRTVKRSNGTTTCCLAGTYTTDDGDEFCACCQGAVQIRIVKVGNELLMMAGAQPCGDSMPMPRVRRKTKPRTTPRHGRGKAK